MKDTLSRRNALKLSGLLSLSYLVDQPMPRNSAATERYHAFDPGLKVGIIGFGIRGEQLLRAAGFPTTTWLNENKGNQSHKEFLNQKDLNITITGVCDLYHTRASNALAAAGKTARIYRSYKELMASTDIDAVIIATPDHMHAPMVIEAARQKKHVYVEKCFTHTYEEAALVYKAVKEAGITFQLGHQLRQKDTYHQARDILYLDILGKTTLIQSSTNRNTPKGAWVYDIPEDANGSTIDWNQFDAHREFDADRFFRWRKYWDYGTGLAGDLFTHEFDSLNAILKLGIPYSAVASGGIYYYKDGREVPDVFQACFEYPDKGLSLLYSATLANDTPRETMIMGSDATMYLSNKVRIFPNSNSQKYAHKLSSGLMSVNEPFYQYPSDKVETAVAVDAISGATTEYFRQKGMMSTYQNGIEIDPTHLHILEWLLCIRNGLETSCSIESAYQEAVTAHMATLSYKYGKKVVWIENEKKLTW